MDTQPRFGLTLQQAEDLAEAMLREKVSWVHISAVLGIPRPEKKWEYGRPYEKRPLTPQEEAAFAALKEGTTWRAAAKIANCQVATLYNKLTRRGLIDSAFGQKVRELRFQKRKAKALEQIKLYLATVPRPLTDYHLHGWDPLVHGQATRIQPLSKWRKELDIPHPDKIYRLPIIKRSASNGP